MAKPNRRLTLADLVVLSLLAEEPMHGYQIVSQLEYRDAKDWAPVSRPQVYYSINKLAELKLIEPQKDASCSLGPERVRYKLTHKGDEELIRELSKLEWATSRTPPPFLTWMALSSNLPRKETLRVMQSRKTFLTKELEREFATLKAVEAGSGPMTLAANLMIKLTLELFEAELRWLDDSQMALTKSRTPREK